MFRISVVVGCAVVVAVSANAESFNSRLARGQALLRTGDLDDAITIFRDLQVDRPESEALEYGLGCAHYAKAMKAARENDPVDAASALSAAIEAFDTASMTPNASLRQDARYNRSTALGQLAKQAVAAQDHERVVPAFEEAILAFEDYLRRYPDHADAATNLNNLRYELKRYLQQAQPPDEQEQNGSKGQEGSESQQDQDQSSQGENSQEGDQQQEQQPGQSGQEEQGDQEQPQDSGEPEEMPSEQQMAEAQPQDQSGESQPQAVEENRQNIEAILDTLQDIDEQQQREMRQRPGRKGINTKWW